jgi:hypothetical protein
MTPVLLALLLLSMSSAQMSFWEVTTFYSTPDCSDGNGYEEYARNLFSQGNYDICRTTSLHSCKSGEPFKRSCFVTFDGMPPTAPHPVQLWLYANPSNPEQRGCVAPDATYRYSWKADICIDDPALPSRRFQKYMRRRCGPNGFYNDYYGDNQCTGAAFATDLVINSTVGVCTQRIFEVTAAFANYTCTGITTSTAGGSGSANMPSVLWLVAVLALCFGFF